MNSPIKVLVIDDSAVVRKVMSEILEREPGIKVIGTASDPIFAHKKMMDEWPDVITLDIEMPRMNGITFLKALMSQKPTPVIVCSTLTANNSETAIQALAAGAFAIINKPTLGLKDFLSDSADDLISTVQAAFKSNSKRLSSSLNNQYTHKTNGPTSSSTPRIPTTPLTSTHLAQTTLTQTTDRIIGIGTSTGGTQALEVVLRALPRTTPGIVVVQHMPEKFTALFAQRLNNICEVEVLEAEDGQRVINGRVLIAPGGKHLSVKMSGAQYIVQVADGPPVNRHKPSVDVLFRSLARYAGKNAIGVIMTGMGNDGARGLKEMFDKGAKTIAQDEESCVVFGMPKEAIQLNGVSQIVPLERIASLLK